MRLKRYRWNRSKEKPYTMPLIGLSHLLTEQRRSLHGLERILTVVWNAQMFQYSSFMRMRSANFDDIFHVTQLK